METTDLLTYLLTPAAQVGLIMALAEVIKRLGLDARFIPVVDVALGVISGIVIYTLYLSMHPVEGLVIGVALGLSACGLFSGVKNVSEKIKEG